MSSFWRRNTILVVILVVMGAMTGCQGTSRSPGTAPLPTANPILTKTSQPTPVPSKEPLAIATPTPVPSGNSPQEVQKRVDALVKQVQDNPSDVAAKVSLAGLYFQLKVYPRAADYYADALDLDPNNAKVRNDFGSALLYQGMVGLARREYQKAIALDSTLPDAHFNLAIVLSHSGTPDIPGALTEWRQVIQLAPESDLARSSEAYVKSYEKQLATPTPEATPVATPAG